MKTKTMAMFATLMIALSVVGFTYSTWSDTVDIDGTVHMGDLLMGFSDDDYWCYQNELPYEPGDFLELETHFAVEWPDPNKDVATCVVGFETLKESVHTLKTAYDKLTITVDKAYPCLWTFVVVNLHNIGTTPIHITKVTITPITADLIWDEVQGCFWKDFDGDGTKDPDEIIINFGVCKVDEAMPHGMPPAFGALTKPLVCNQIDPSECLWILIWFHFKEPAEPCHTYEFEVEIEGIQWNEYRP